MNLFSLRETGLLNLMEFVKNFVIYVGKDNKYKGYTINYLLKFILYASLSPSYQ